VRDERAYLLHAIAAIDAVQSYTVDGREAFFTDGKTQDAVIRNIEVIGQAVKGISDDTRGLVPDVPWRQIAGMRDKLSHEYFGVDLALVWGVVEHELPTVRPQLERLSERLAGEPELGDAAEVTAGAERSSGARQHDRARRALDTDRLERVRERLEGVLVERVQVCQPIEHEQSHIVRWALYAQARIRSAGSSHAYSFSIAAA
jgi:uncharacterized protein with HEPN domain